MPKKLLTFSCWLMVVVYPISSFAGDAVGLMSVTGTVLIDNQPIEARGAVFAGNVVETKAQSSAVVTGQGKVVSLGENSSVQLGTREVELRSGAVVISSMNGIVLKAEGATVSTTPGTQTKFLARKVNGAVQILALQGTVAVSDGNEAVNVPANAAVSVNAGEPQQPTATKPTIRVPRPHIGWLHNDDIGILIVVALAIAAGVALGIYNAKHAPPATPAGP